MATVVIVPAAALGVHGDFFQPSTSPEAAGAAPVSVAAANLNGDANADLAIANFATTGTVRVLLGDGTGNFTPAGTSPETVGSAPQSVAAANLGGTASIDLAVANTTSDDVSILLGDGMGDFTPAAVTSPEPIAPGDGPVSVTTANLGGDANLDLAVANNGTDNVTILIGDGTGNFTSAGPPETVAPGDGPRSVAAGNLGGDANIDLAVSNVLTDNVTILIGDGTGNFTPAAGTSPETVGDSPQGIVAVNLNGDAFADLAVANSAGGVTILLADGTGNFTPAGTSPEAAGNFPQALAAANLGGDANTDLAVANTGSGDVTVLIGDGTGNFTATASSPEAAGDGPISIAAANLGGTTNTDLAVANITSSNVSILLNDFVPPPVIPPVTTPNTPLTPAPAPKKCKKGQKLKKGKCVKKKRKKK